MRLLLTKYANTAQTIIIVPLRLSPLCRLSLVRLGVYIVNLCAFYFYRLIGKLTAFLQLQEFSLRNLTVRFTTARGVLLTAQVESVPVPRATQCMRVV